MSAGKSIAAVLAIFVVLLAASAVLTGALGEEVIWTASRDGAAIELPLNETSGGTLQTTGAGVAPVDDPMDRRLLRTLQIGSPQGVSIDEMLAYARGDEADYTGHVLARAALTVVGEDRGFPEWPLERLLKRTLTQLQRGAVSATGMPHTMPRGFDGEHLVSAIVYALVVSGREDEAVEVLEQQLGFGSDFKRGVVLQALRDIGTDRANGAVQRVADEGTGSLAPNLLADQHYPFLHELYDHWELIPLSERNRESLTAIAARDCGRPASMAVYLLGFFAPATDPEQERGELDALREVTGFSERCYYNRYFAMRSLAMRSPETIDFWVGLYRDETDAWQRAQIVRIAFAHFGRDFLDPALELLAEEPVQYVQWELMHGNIELREGAAWRGYWDIWLTPTLQFRLDFPAGQGDMPGEDLDGLLRWLGSGARPQHPWVYNHMLYGIARHIEGADTRRFLRRFDRHPDRNDNWWILSPLRDPAALPLLRYWATLPTSDQQGGELERTIRGMESRLPGPSDASGGSDVSCCEPTRACLLAAVDDAGSQVAPPLVIDDEARAQAWLAGELPEPPPARGPDLTFLDELERIALVTWPSQDRAERWEHLFGCWRKVEGG